MNDHLHFYSDIIAFSDFEGITRDEHFHALPEDWNVIITDVCGSTKAIETGRYKDVNTVGAASIAAAQNALGRVDFPYVFGGDGATLVIPANKTAKVQHSLLGLKKLSRKQFGLELRIGIVSVAEILRDGGCLEVARFELKEGKSVAIFRGGGLMLAEDKIKRQADHYTLEEDPFAKADLSGLSCRWQPVRSQKGKVISLLISARQYPEEALYRKTISHLNQILGGEISRANPIDMSQPAYKTLSQCFADEIRYHSSIWSFSFILRFLEIIYAVGVFKYKFPALFFDAWKYASAMSTHSDYRKFDDMLRMVIDCSEKEIKEIKKFLENQYQEGLLFYGIHESDESLITCLVSGLSDGEHIHFIDGGNGGYAMAAKQLKAQLKTTHHG